MAESASPFIIRELTGDKREVRLVGRALPYPPFTLDGSQRFNNTWYAGSPEGTLQILGAKENQTSINGRWKDKFIRPVSSLDPEELAASGFTGPDQQAAGQNGQPPATIDGESVASVRDLCIVMDDIRRKGQVIEVLWLDQKRTGILANFRQSWFMAQEVEWAITFEWQNQGDALEASTVQTFESDSSDALVEIDNQLNDLVLIRSSAVDVSNTSFAGIGRQPGDFSINQGLADLQRGLDELQDSILVVSQTVLSPVTLAQRMIGIFEYMYNAAVQTRDNIILQAEAAILNAQNLTAGERLSELQEVSQRERSARRIANVCAMRADRIRSTVDPELVATFVSREGQDLRDVSIQYYGVEDEWKALMQFNNLETSLLPANKTIFVPRTPPQVSC